MPIAQEILFPVDFSLRAAALVPAVEAVARRLGIPVTLLHAVDALRPDLEIADAGLLVQIEARASQKLTSFAAGAFTGLEVRRQVVPGPASQAVVDHAGKMSAPLIMMPTQGQSAFRRLLLGSVTASVLHDALGPVWTSAHCEDGGPLPTSYSNVVCAVDLSPRTAEVLKHAAAFAAEFGAVLHVVHLVPGIDPRFESGAASRAHAYLMDCARGDYPALARAAGVSAPLEVLEDVSLPAGIAAAVKRHNADLLVIGRGTSQGVLGRLRTNAHDLIRQSPSPVLSV